MVINPHLRLDFLKINSDNCLWKVIGEFLFLGLDLDERWDWTRETGNISVVATEASADPEGNSGLGDPSELSHLQTGGKALMPFIVQPLERDWASCLHWGEFLRGLSGGLSTTTPFGLGKGFCPARVWVLPPPTTGNIAVPTPGYSEPGSGMVLALH